MSVLDEVLAEVEAAEAKTRQEQDQAVEKVTDPEGVKARTDERKAKLDELRGLLAELEAEDDGD